MRRFALYLGLATALVASCSIQEENFETPQPGGEMFYATFEQPAEDGTKIYVNENFNLRWTADDRVSIFNKNTSNQQFRFLGETGDNSGEFSKVEGTDYGSGEQLSNIVSVYPYREDTEITEEGVLTVYLPEEQIYTKKSFGLGANTMVAISSSNNLQYKNVGGYLRVSLFGEGRSVEAVELRGHNGEKLSGTAFVTMPLEGVPTVEMADYAFESVVLSFETPVELGKTAEESIDIWFVIPPTTFSEGFTISVFQTNDELFEMSTFKSIFIERNKLLTMSPVEVETVIFPSLPVPEVVDLGLSVKWASFNLGATRPEEFGDYYAWGETEPYYYYLSFDGIYVDGPWKPGKEAGYSNLSYKWTISGYWDDLYKYCTDPNYGHNGFTDGKTVLDLEDDTAHMNLGGKWRMPTADEMRELTRKCIWEWTTINGVNGARVSRNGMSIFIPVSGYLRDHFSVGVGNRGCYWTSSLSTVSAGPSNACYLDFDSSHCDGGGFDAIRTMYRSWGATIRPVCD